MTYGRFLNKFYISALKIILTYGRFLDRYGRFFHLNYIKSTILHINLKSQKNLPYYSFLTQKSTILHEKIWKNLPYDTKKDFCIPYRFIISHMTWIMGDFGPQCGLHPISRKGTRMHGSISPIWFKYIT